MRQAPCVEESEVLGGRLRRELQAAVPG